MKFLLFAVFLASTNGHAQTPFKDFADCRSLINSSGAAHHATSPQRLAGFTRQFESLYFRYVGENLLYSAVGNRLVYAYPPEDLRNFESDLETVRRYFYAPSSYTR